MIDNMSSNGHVKSFVVDTNVLLHNPNALFMFADNEVVIPFDVIEELDKFKAGTDDLGRNARTADNRIICCALTLHQQGLRVVFISKDINARIKSDALGLTTEDFEAQKVDFEHLYTGWREHRVARREIDRLFAHKQLELGLADLKANE